MPRRPPRDILTDYVPALIAEHGLRPSVLRPPNDPVLDDFYAAVALRNKIAHGAGTLIDPKALERYLLTIRDTLWMLDVFLGHRWARSYVRPDVLNTWDPQ